MAKNLKQMSYKQTVFFWLSFGLLAPMILANFYYHKGKKRRNQLRLASMVFQLVAFVLLFFPWVETEGVVKSGFSLTMAGNWGLIAYLAALLFSLVLIVSLESKHNILGAKVALVNSVWLFVIMLRLFPETKRLSSTDIAPIVSVLLMLVNNVAVLLLWHQLQKKK
mgnify:CR=1 FL=1